MRLKLFILSLMLILALGLVSASYEIGPFEKDDCIKLIQTCSDCTYVNLTSVVYPPNSSIEYLNVNMTQNVSTYSYEFCNTSTLGKYTYNTLGNPGGELVTQPVDFYITPSGNILDQGQSVALIGSLLLMIVISILFFYIANKTESNVGRIAFYCLSVIGFIMAILYTIIIIQQTLFGFESILVGIETFWLVIKMGLTVGIAALGVIIFLIMLKAWKIHRGLIDVN